MQRRTLLKLGVGATVTLAVLGGGAALLRPGLVDGKMTEPAQTLMRAVAEAVLEGSLPADASARATALDAHLERLQGLVLGFPPATRDELSQLLALLTTAPGRLAIGALSQDWPQAGVRSVQAALQAMRTSRLAIRLQVYQALRDLTNAAYYADAGTWTLLGYPGPRALA